MTAVAAVGQLRPTSLHILAVPLHQPYHRHTSYQHTIHYSTHTALPAETLLVVGRLVVLMSRAELCLR